MDDRRGPRVVGRDDAAARIEAALATGPVLVVGPPAVGRSTVLALVARSRPGAVLAMAGPPPPGTDVALGTVRRLLDGLAELADRVDPTEAPGRPGPAPGAAVVRDGGSGEVDPHGVALGVVDALARVAETTPVTLVVDDLDRADAASARALAVLAADLPPGVTLLAAAPSLAAASGAVPWAHVEALAPLTVDETADLADAHLGRPPAPAFVAAAHRATTGRPGLLVPLLAAAATAGRGGADDDGADLEALALPTVPAQVAARLDALGADAVVVARAAAVLGASRRTDVLAAAAGLDVPATATATARLADAGLLTGDVVAEARAWTSSLLGPAVRALVGEGEAALLAGRAAATMATAGDPDEEVGAVLLGALPVGERWAVDRLRGAAEAAAARGAPEAAGRLYARLLDEPLGAEERLWAEAGRARTELQVGDPTGIARLTALAPRIPDRGLRARARFATGRALLWDGRGAEAAAAFAAAADDAEPVDPEMAARSDAGRHLALAIAATPDRPPVEARPRGTVGDASGAGAAALAAALDGAPAAEVPGPGGRVPGRRAGAGRADQRQHRGRGRRRCPGGRG